MDDRASVPSARRDEPHQEIQEHHKSLELLHPDLDVTRIQTRTTVPEDFEQVVNSETATARSAPLGIHEKGSSIAVTEIENGFAKKDIIYVCILSPSFFESNVDGIFMKVDFEQDDKENPATFSRRKKWAITICASAFTGVRPKCPTTTSANFSNYHQRN